MRGQDAWALSLALEGSGQFRSQDTWVLSRGLCDFFSPWGAGGACVPLGHRGLTPTPPLVAAQAGHPEDGGAAAQAGCSHGPGLAAQLRQGPYVAGPQPARQAPLPEGQCQGQLRGAGRAPPEHTSLPGAWSAEPGAPGALRGTAGAAARPAAAQDVVVQPRPHQYHAGGRGPQGRCTPRPRVASGRAATQRYAQRGHGLRALFQQPRLTLDSHGRSRTPCPGTPSRAPGPGTTAVPGPRGGGGCKQGGAGTSRAAPASDAGRPAVPCCRHPRPGELGAGLLGSVSGCGRG